MALLNKKCCLKNKCQVSQSFSVVADSAEDLTENEKERHIYNACQWDSSFRGVLLKCTFGIHCWKCLLYAALWPPLHVEQTK